MQPNEGIRTGVLPLATPNNEVRKNEAYLTIQLVAAQYKASGTWWQKKLGGTDSLALTTCVTYRSGAERIEAMAVHQRNELKGNRISNLGMNKLLVEKIPASADALSIEIKMTVLQTDRLNEVLTILQRPEYQPALELTPKIVGQVVTLSALVKALLSDEKAALLMHGSYAGILPVTPSIDPSSAGQLTEGWLFFLAPGEKKTLWDAPTESFSIQDLQLFNEGKRVDETYALLRITADAQRGADQASNWSKKYEKALQHLDSLHVRKKGEEQLRIFNEAIGSWLEGNILLDTDPNYIDREKKQLMQQALEAIEQKYIGLGGTISLTDAKRYKERITLLKA